VYGDGVDLKKNRFHSGGHQRPIYAELAHVSLSLSLSHSLTQSEEVHTSHVLLIKQFLW
jgi:hypothetical protein